MLIYTLNGLVITALMLGIQNKLQKIDSKIIILAKKELDLQN